MDADHNVASETSQSACYAYLNEISKYKLLSVDEEISLFEKIQASDNVAKDLFIKSNLKLVVNEAKKYYVPGYNDLLDLIQEGNIGLIKAVDQFDLSKGCKFSTYAVYVINKAIQKAPLRSGLPLEIPRDKLVLIAKIKKAIERFDAETGRKPSFTELSDALNVSVRRIIPLMPYVTPSFSLNSKLNNDENSREVLDVFDAYYDEKLSDEEESFLVKEGKEELFNIIKKVLTDKEMYIVCSRWGLFGTAVKSVAALATELNMSKQGARQCGDRAVEKLRKHLLQNQKTLSDFI